MDKPRCEICRTTKGLYTCWKYDADAVPRYWCNEHIPSWIWDEWNKQNNSKFFVRL